MTTQPTIACVDCKKVSDPIAMAMYGGVCEGCARTRWEALQAWKDGEGDPGTLPDFLPYMKPNRIP